MAASSDTVTRYLTFDEVVRDIIDHLDNESINILRNIPKDRMGVFHHSTGRFIRNHYKLWDSNNPICRKYFVDTENAVGLQDEDKWWMKNGVDCHPDHPDAVSNRITCAVWDEVNEFWEKVKT